MEQQPIPEDVLRARRVVKWMSGCAVLTVVVFLVILVLRAIVSSAPQNPAVIGQRVVWSGTVTDRGRGTGSGTLYVIVEGNGREIKCYADRWAPIGARITVAGTIEGWTDNVGGSLRPCIITQ